MPSAKRNDVYYRFRDTQGMHISLSGIKYANRAEVEKVIEVLNGNPHIRSLSLQNVNMHPQWLALVLQAAATCPNLEEMDLAGNPLHAPAMNALIQGLPHWPALHTLNADNCGINSKSIAPLARALGEYTQGLRNLELKENAIASAGIEPIAALLPRLPHLRRLQLSNNTLESKALSTLSDAIGQHGKLAECELHYNHFSEAAMDAFTAARQIEHNRILVHTPFVHPSIDAFCKHNRLRAASLIAELHGVDASAPDFSAIPGHVLASIDARLPAIEVLISPQELFAPLVDHLRSLPQIDASHATREALLTADEKGDTPLGNPATWRHIEPVLQSLRAAGTPLTHADLLQPDRHGQPYLRTALAGTPETVLPALNQAGIRVPVDTLLNTKGEPTLLLQQLIDDGAAPLLFTRDNLKGESPMTVRQLHAALPEDQQQQIRNLNALIATLRSGTEKGQGR
jgi:hypothetical protein